MCPKRYRFQVADDHASSHVRDHLSTIPILYASCLADILQLLVQVFCSFDLCTPAISTVATGSMPYEICSGFQGVPVGNEVGDFVSDWRRLVRTHDRALTLEYLQPPQPTMTDEQLKPVTQFACLSCSIRHCLMSCQCHIPFPACPQMSLKYVRLPVRTE